NETAPFGATTRRSRSFTNSAVVSVGLRGTPAGSVQTSVTFNGAPACTSKRSVRDSAAARPAAVSTSKTRSFRRSPGKYSASSRTGNPNPWSYDGTGAVSTGPSSVQRNGTRRADAIIVAFSSAALGVKRSDGVAIPLG